MKIDKAKVQASLMAGSVLLSAVAGITPTTWDDKLAKALGKAAINDGALTLLSEVIEIFTEDLTEEEVEAKLNELKTKSAQAVHQPPAKQAKPSR